jgi:hypothetical protein
MNELASDALKLRLASSQYQMYTIQQSNVNIIYGPQIWVSVRM